MSTLFHVSTFYLLAWIVLSFLICYYVRKRMKASAQAMQQIETNDSEQKRVHDNYLVSLFVIATICLIGIICIHMFYFSIKYWPLLAICIVWLLYLLNNYKRKPRRTKSD